MSLAQDIMDAVKKGGMDKWRPASEQNAKERTKHKQKIDSKAREVFILSKMSNKEWTISTLSKETGIPVGTIREYMYRLAKQVKCDSTRATYVYKRIA